MSPVSGERTCKPKGALGRTTAMSDRRDRRNKGDVIELVLTLLAVIAGSVAATGAFLGASYERDRVELERRPAVLLACQPEFHALDVAEGTRPPTNTILLTARGARWIHIVSDGRSDTPQPFARCTLTSYGQLPVFNLRVNLQVQLLGRRSRYARDGRLVVRRSRALAVPALSLRLDQRGEHGRDVSVRSRSDAHTGRYRDGNSRNVVSRSGRARSPATNRRGRRAGHRSRRNGEIEGGVSRARSRLLLRAAVALGAYERRADLRQRRRRGTYRHRAARLVRFGANRSAWYMAARLFTPRRVLLQLLVPSVHAGPNRRLEVNDRPAARR